MKVSFRNNWFITLQTLSLFWICCSCFSCVSKETPPAPPANTEIPSPISQLTPELENSLDLHITQSDSLVEIGQLQDALNKLTEGIQKAESTLGPLHPKTANLQHSMGNLYNNHLQDWKQASMHFQKAVDSRKHLLDSLPTLSGELAKSYFALARVQRLQGAYEAGLSNIHSCLSLREAAPIDSMSVGWTHYEAGVIYQQSGDLQNALQHLQQAARLAIRPVDEANAWNEIAGTYDLLRQSDQAVRFYKMALERFKKLELHWHMGSCLVNLGGAYLRNGSDDQALLTLLEAQALNALLLEADPTNMDVKLAKGAIVNNLGSIYMKQGLLDRALEAAKESLVISIANCGSPFHPEVASSFDNLGNVYVEMEQAKEALLAYKNGIQSIVPDYKPSFWLDNPILTVATISEKPLLLTLLGDKAATLFQFADQHENPIEWEIAAFHTYQTIDTLLVQSRQACREDGSKYFLAREAAPFYEAAIAVSYLLWEKTKNPFFKEAMLAFCERNKAGVLVESLNDVRVKENLVIGAEIIQREQALQQSIARQELQIYQAQQNNEDTKVLLDSLFHLKRKVERLSQKLEQSAPAYFKQKFALSNTPTPIVVQKKLQQGQLLLEYHLGQEQLYTIAITKKTIEVYAMPIGRDFFQHIDQFRQSVSDWGFITSQPKAAEQQFLSSAHSLYQVLLEPALADCSAPISSLTIIPDGVLGYLSFEALLTQPTSSWQNPNTPYLLREYAINYTYGAHFSINNSRSGNRTPNTHFTGFGLAYDDRTLTAANQVFTPVDASSGTQRALGQLNSSSKEVMQIAELMDGKAWLDSSATKANFLKHAPNGNIIHFAGHGFTDSKEPLNSSLLFTKTTDSTDFLLRAADLYGCSFHAQLAVLSACNTGQGSLQEGEGIMSFARAFAYAGVPSLVMSLWSITDAPSASIMEAFYEQLNMGQQKDEALRQAKLSYLKTTNPAHAIPAYWAGAVLMGDPAPLHSTSIHLWMYLIGSLILAVGGYFYWRSKS